MSAAYHVGKKEIAWGLGAQLLGIGASLLLLPFLVRYLSAQDLALWFVFASIAGLASLLDFGFQATIMRQAVYVYGGAKDLLCEGIAHGAPSSAIDKRLLVTIIRLAQRIYLVAGSIAAFLLLCGGTWYVSWLAREWADQDRLSALVGWILYALGTCLTLYFGYYSALLQARGNITTANQAAVFSRTIYLLSGVAILIHGGGLPGLGAASLAASLGLRVTSRMAFLDPETKAILAMQHVLPRISEYFWVLWHNASRLGVNAIGAFLIQRSNILVAATLVGLDGSARFVFTAQLFGIAAMLSGAIISLFLPRLAQLQLAKDIKELRATFALSHLVSMLFFCGVSIAILAFGPFLLNALESQSKLVDPDMCAAIAVILLLEVNHSNHAAMITTSNRVPFVRAALYSGAFIVILSTVVLKFTSLGIWGILLSQAVVQAAYNNWKWPHENLQSLGVSFRQLLIIGIEKIGRRCR